MTNRQTSIFYRNFLMFQRYAAFTLAEVLITLGIIGVVAALTISTFLSRVAEAQTKAGVKKAFSTLSSAYALTKLDNGGDNFKCYRFGYYDDIYGWENNTECRELWESMKTKFKATTICDYDNGAGLANFGKCLPENGVGVDDGINITDDYGKEGYQTSYQGHTNAVVLQDGTYLFTYGWEWWIPLFAYDINGFKGPNKFGHDVFCFEILNYKMAIDENCPGSDDLEDYILGAK